MDVRGKVVIITGAARGIGKAMAERFARDGVEGVVLSDRDEKEINAVARQIETSGVTVLALRADVSVEADMRVLVDSAIARFGRIDLFCSNAGIMCQGGPDAPDDIWNVSWSVNVMAHVYAARLALPHMLARGSGYFLNTCSAAGLLTSLGAAPYAASKHAAVGFAEWLAITYGGRGIKVSALCPQAVRTEMLATADSGNAAAAVKSAGRIIETEDVAESVVRGLAEERFLIVPHEEMMEFVRRKSSDIDRWIGGMRKILPPT